MFLRVLFVFLMLFSSSGEARRCTKEFSVFRQQKLSVIGYTQNYIGKYWTYLKLQSLIKEYEAWIAKEKNIGKTPQDFIFWYTQKEKLIPAIRDVNGQLRIIDRHHTYHAILEFLGVAANGRIFLEIVQDYTGINPMTGYKWTPIEMVNHMDSKNWININGYGVKLTPKQTVEALNNLPKSIFALRDSPERSVMSMVFRRLGEEKIDIKLKGPDFVAHTQNRLIQILKKEGIELILETIDPYSVANITRVMEALKNNKVALEFLLESTKINPLKPNRYPKVVALIKELIEELEASD